VTTFADGVFSFGGIPSAFSLYNGKWFFVDPANGSDGNDGRAPNRALATLYRAHVLMTSGNNDVCVLIGNGGTSATARLSLANAVAADPTAAVTPTAGTLVWSKNACHLIGVTAPTQVAQRARLAPPTGTYTATTFGSGTVVTISGSGCHFENFSSFFGFSTGSTSAIAFNVTGSRNYFKNIDMGGLADAESAGSASARTLVIDTGAENTFEDCYIGLDTVTRTAANASVEFKGGTARNTFKNCIFPFMTSAATPLGIIGTGAACMDRWQLFRNCDFINNIKSTSTTMTVLASMSSASPGGMLMFKDCNLVGITDFGDTNGLANTQVMGASGTAATTGIAVTPS